jgi:hypothetical protein
MSQLELFEEPPKVVRTVPTTEEVRGRLTAVMETLRATTACPWSDRELARWRLVVPQMADWLPEDEREATCAEFARLVGRF